MTTLVLNNFSAGTPFYILTSVGILWNYALLTDVNSRSQDDVDAAGTGSVNSPQTNADNRNEDKCVWIRFHQLLHYWNKKKDLLGSFSLTKLRRTCYVCFRFDEFFQLMIQLR